MTPRFVVPLLIAFQCSFAQSWLYEEQADIPTSSTDSLVKESMDLGVWENVHVDVKTDDSLQDDAPTGASAPTPSAAKSVGATSDAHGDSVVAQGVAVLRGLVFGSEDSKPLSEASVVLRMDSVLVETKTDANGMFALRSLRPGSYQMRISRKGYTVWSKDNIVLSGGTQSVEEYALDKRVAKGKVFTVQKPQSAPSADLMAKRQQGGVVMEGVSAEQIAKTTDSDAGAIAKRVTGTSVVGGKYVYVRGLGERYTNMTLNGLPVPTPEKDKRVVPQDLFPANALESFAIYKSFNADLPADFAGGSVALVTKGFPDKDFTKVSVGVGTGGGLGDDRLDFSTGNAVADYLGYVSDDQEVPSGVPGTVSPVVQDSLGEIANIARRWDNNWGIDTSKVLPDLNVSVTSGKVWNYGKGRHGFLGNVTFKNSYTTEERERLKTVVESVRDTVEVIRNGKVVKGLRVVNDTLPDGTISPLRILKTGLIQDLTVGSYQSSLSGLLDWGYADKDNQLWVKTLYANLSEKSVTYNNSQAVDGISAGQENMQEERFILDFERRSIMVGQLGGSHYIGRSVLDSMAWAASVASSEGRQPDTRKYYYIRLNDSTLQWDAKQPWASRQFQEFGENLYAARADFFLVVPPEWSHDDVLLKNGGWLSRVELPRLQTGFLGYWRDRSFDMNTYSWVDNTYRPTGSDYDLVESVMNPDSVAARVAKNGSGFRSFLGDYDTYEATEASLANYAQIEQSAVLWGVPTTLVLGGRLEMYSLDFHAPFTSEITLETPALQEDSAIDIRVREWEFYPAASLSFEFVPKTKTRFLYSGTIVRPEMRERTPTLFFETEEEITVQGNPDLRNTYIDNYDFRFEWYLPKQQLLSFSLFYKNFTDPIEPVIDGNLAPPRKYFQNADGAFVRGLEIEADIAPGRWISGAGKFWEGFGVYGNAAWIESEVKIDSTSEGASLLTSKKRPMIGQSPYVYNAKLTHEYELSPTQKILNGLLFNVTGRRIRSLGVYYVPDTYEEPFASLDYLAKYTYAKHALGVKVKNLLNSEQRYTVTEYNDGLHYYKVSDADRDRIYSNNGVQRTFVISRRLPGVSWAISYEYQF